MKSKIITEYEKRGWNDISTGGGCEAFSYDLVENPPTPLDLFFADCEALQDAYARGVDPSEIRAKLRNIYKALIDAGTPYILCTELGGVNQPTRKNQCIGLGLYDGEGQPVSLKNDGAEPWDYTLTGWKGFKLTSNVLFEHHEEIIQYFQESFEASTGEEVNY